MSDYEPKCKKTLPIIFDDRMPASNLTPKLVGRVNDNTEDLKNLYEETEDEITHVKQDINELEEGKADASGTSENLTAGNAEQLLTDKGITDKVPYLLRASGGNGADREVDKIVGGTIAWNQRYNITYSNTVYGVSISVVNGTVTITGVSTSAGNGASFAWTNFAFPENHAVIILKDFSLPSGDFIFEQYSGYGSKTDIIGRPFKISSQDQYVIPQLKIANANVTYNITGHLSVIDLTQMFGTAIADQAYAMEQATAGSGINWLKSMGFFTADYYPYDAGTLKSVEGLTAHSMIGFNQWDEEWKLGTYATSDGTYTVDNTHICCTNPIKAVAGATYYFNTAGANAHICFMDASMNLISSNINVNNATLTAPANSRYILFNMALAYGVTYNNDICINFSDPAKNGAYEPYVKHSYALDSDLELRGIPKLDSNNELYYDGDEYESEGTVTRKYGIVDLGTLTWQYNSNWNGYPAFYTIDLRTIIKAGFDSTVGNIINNKYIVVSRNTLYDNDIKAMALTGDDLSIRDSAYSDAATFKTAMSGVYLVYELATPTTEEAEPYQNPQIVDPYGTESYETTGIVPVGHDTFYPENLRAKIEGLPFNFATLIAPTESTYKATRAYSANNLFIVNNILYKATTSIASGGTITPGTNCTATTLAEIIAALS